MDRTTFLSLRAKFKTQKNIAKKLSEISAKIDWPEDVFEFMGNNQYELEIEIDKDGKINVTNASQIDKGSEEEKKLRVGDSNLISSLDVSLKEIGSKLVDHIRSLDPCGRLVENSGGKKYTNYRIENGKVHKNDLGNFVSFFPQHEKIKVSLWKGDYSFLSSIKIVDDSNYYPYFHISDYFQVFDAMDAIELSYYYYIGLD